MTESLPKEQLSEPQRETVQVLGDVVGSAVGRPDVVSRRSVIAAIPILGPIILALDDLANDGKISSDTAIAAGTQMMIGASLACGGTPDFGEGIEPSVSQEFGPDNLRDLPPELMMFSIVGRMDLKSTLGLADIIKNPAQSDLVLLFLQANQEAEVGGIAPVQRRAINEGFALAVPECSDSRMVLPNAFPIQVEGTTLAASTTSAEVQGFAMDVAKIGTQPTIHPEGVNQGMFVAHSTSCDIMPGCGALTGVKTLLESESGVAQLINHGITPGTIKELNRLIELGATADPMEWARVGALMQADINYVKYGVHQTVGFGLWGHADGTFLFGGTISSSGEILTAEAVSARHPVIAAYADFIDKPHPIIESIAQGQKPSMNVVSGSRTFSVRTMLGEAAQAQGEVFKVGADLTPGVPITALEADNLFKNIGYSISGLEGESKVMFLIADSASDMDALRSALIAGGEESIGLSKFLGDGGVIVELMPGETAGFTGPMVVRSAEILNEEVSMLNKTSLVAIPEMTVADQLRASRAIDVSKARMGAGLTTQAELTKLQAIWGATKPMRSFLANVALGGLRVAGDILILRDIWSAIDKRIFNHNLVYTNDIEHIVRRADVTAEREAKAYSGEEAFLAYYGVKEGNPMLLLGMVEKVEIPFDELSNSYGGVAANVMQLMDTDGNTYPDMDLWRPMVEGEVLPGVAFTFDIAPSSGPLVGPRVKHWTSLVIRPDFGDNGAPVYSSEDRSQVMRLDNEVSGLPIMGSVPDSSQIIMSIEEGKPQTGYYWLMVPVPDERRFDLMYIGARPL